MMRVPGAGGGEGRGGGGVKELKCLALKDNHRDR